MRKRGQGPKDACDVIAMGGRLEPKGKVIQEVPSNDNGVGADGRKNAPADNAAAPHARARGGQNSSSDPTEASSPHSSPPAADVAAIGFPLTDTGNAERLVARFRNLFRFCPPRKRSLVWDSRRWAWDQIGLVEQLAKKTVRAIYAEVEHAKSDEAAEQIVKHAAASERKERRAAMIVLAQSEPGIPVLPQELDQHPWHFNVLNGTIDLRTGELLPHNRDQLITKLAPVNYDPEATSPLWIKYLKTATGGDVEFAAYLQRLAGIALQGVVTEKSFWFLYGPPDGSKSTFITALMRTMGDYAVSTSFSTWLQQTNTGGNRGDLVALMGARLVTSVEVRKNARFDEEILKRCTGGDIISAAAKYEHEVNFAATFTLVLAANDAPSIRDDDEGVWNRVKRVPFTNSIPKSEQDKAMSQKLSEPDVQEAILAWAVQGCLNVQAHGMGTCEVVNADTQKYRGEMDRVAGFFADCCVLDSEAKEQTESLRRAYESWCRESGCKVPLSGKDLARRLREHGCTASKSGSCRYWRGIRLLRDGEEAQTSGLEVDDFVGG